MDEFKVFIETDHTHYFRIQADNPELASKLALKEFMESGSLTAVEEVLVMDSEDELGFGMPVFQATGAELTYLLKVI